jgi:hypothetical protein
MTESASRIIETAVEAASLAFEKGLLRIKRPRPTPETRMMALGLELAVMGAEPDTILKLLELLMRSSGEAFRGDLANRLSLEAVRLILDGEEPGRVRTLLREKAGMGKAFDAAPGPIPILDNGDLIVYGNVGDGMAIKAQGSIRVEGQVGAATLEAGVDIVIVGCVHGRGRGRLSCGGELSAGSLERVEAIAGGKVTVASDVVHAKVECGGDFVGTGGAIVGGSVSAGGAVRAHQLGHYSCGRTAVSALSCISVSGDVFMGVDIRIADCRFEVKSVMESVEFRAAGHTITVAPLPREALHV